MLNLYMGSVLAVIGTVDPQAVVNVEKFSDVIDMSKWDNVIATVLTGDMASETIDFKCYYCDSDGSNPVALKSATQLAASATANDNAQVVICINTNNMAGTSKQHVKFGLVTGSTAGGTCAVLVQGIARQGLTSANDLSTVKEIKQ